MWRLLLCSCLLIPTWAFAAEPDQAAVDSLLTASSDTTLSRKDREKLARKAIDHDKTGRAMHELAKIYMVDGSSNANRNASRWLLRAIDRERENAQYNATYASYFWTIGRRGTALKYALRAIDMDPNNVDARYLAGRYEMWQMTRYLEGERVDYTYNSMGEVRMTTFNMQKWGFEALHEAIRHLTRAIEVDPDHWPSRKILGLVYFEGGMTDELVDLFLDYTGLHPEDQYGHFFLGLGYHSQNDLDRAHNAYVSGLKGMTAEEQNFMMSIFMLTDVKKMKKTGELPDEEKIRRFWTSRDPLYITPANERLMEHCRRVAYSNLRYGDAFKGVPGWRTDQGQAYIRYGHPVGMTAVPAEINTGVDLPSNIQSYLATRAASPWRTSPIEYQPRREIWRYEGFTLIFENTDTRDAFKYRIAWLDDEQSPFGLSTLVKRIPDYYEDPFHWVRYDAPYQIAQFRGKGKKTRIEVYYALPEERVAHSKSGPGLLDVSVRQGLFLFDATWDTLSRKVVRVRKMPRVMYDNGRVGYLFASEQLMVEPGPFYLAAEVEDQKTFTVGTFRDSFDVREFGRDSLEVSDLLLARRIVERDSGPLDRNKFMILSNPIGRYQRNEQAAFYFEVYNLTKNDFGETHYEVTYQVQYLPETRRARYEPDWALRGSLIHWNTRAEYDEDALFEKEDGTRLPTPDWTTAVSYSHRGKGDWEPIQLALDLGGSSPGLRGFRVVIKDLQSNQEVVATTMFRVKW